MISETPFRRHSAVFGRAKRPLPMQSRQRECLLWLQKNIRIDSLRRQNAHPAIDIEAIKEPPESETTEDVTDLFKEIDNLIRQHHSKRDREILFHRERDGWEFDEIADYYSISETNARVITARCRNKIRELYINQTKHTQ